MNTVTSAKLQTSDQGPGGREYVFTDKDFDRISRLIYERAGIVLTQAKRDMAYSRLVRRVRALGLNSFTEYLDDLCRRGVDDDEWQAFTNSLTTNLTSFFREPHHFVALAEQLTALGRKSPINIWCAAASTGEEPYSIAMTAAEHFRSFSTPVRIIATDIDTQVLETASRGVYALDRVEGLGAERLRKFFKRGTGPNDGLARVDDGLRKMIEFRQLNLLEGGWDVKGPLDAIFCRNVMIYFDKPTQLKILSRMVPMLEANGLFYAGHSESYFHATHLIQPIGRTVYRLAGTAGKNP